MTLAMSQHKKTFFLFLIIWLHVSLLDLFFVNYSGPVFLWKENTELKTLAVHFSIALITTFSFMLAEKMHQLYQQGALFIREPLLIACSIGMLAAIGLLLF